MKMFSFEWKKIIKKKTIWMLVVLSMVAVIGIYLFHSITANSVQTKVVNHYDFLIDLYLQDSIDLAMEKEEALIAEDDEWLEEVEMMKEDSLFMHDSYKETKEFYQNETWDGLYQKELDTLEIYVDPSTKDEAVYYFEDEEISDFTLRASYEEIKYLQENEIEPFIQNTEIGMFLPTAYDDFSGRTLELWEGNTERFSKKGIYFIYQLIKLLYIPIIILIGCFIFGNTYSSEITKKHNRIRFYKSLPLHQTKLFFTKYLTGYLGVVLFVVIMLGIPLLVGSIMNDIGDLDYPILVYDGYTTEYMDQNILEDTFHFITLQEYLVRTLIFTFVISLFLYSMYFLISQFSKEPIFNVLVIAIISFAGTFISHPFNPFSYLDTDQVITHEIQLQTWNTDITFVTGVAVTLVLSVVFIILNFIGFKSKSS